MSKLPGSVVPYFDEAGSHFTVEVDELLGPFQGHLVVKPSSALMNKLITSAAVKNVFSGDPVEHPLNSEWISLEKPSGAKLESTFSFLQIDPLSF